MNKYENRYSENWKEKAKYAREKVGNHCCLCLKKFKYLETHHVAYCNRNKKRIAGQERVGVHIFPLCKRCHSKEKGMAHHPDNWISDPVNPELRNRNTPQFYKKLRDNYQLIQELIKCKKSPILPNTKKKNNRKSGGLSSQLPSKTIRK